MVKNLLANTGVIRDIGLITGSGRSPGGRHVNLLHYSCLENSHGQKRLEDYGSYGCKESDITEAA